MSYKQFPISDSIFSVFEVILMFLLTFLLLYTQQMNESVCVRIYINRRCTNSLDDYYFCTIKSMYRLSLMCFAIRLFIFHLKFVHFFLIRRRLFTLGELIKIIYRIGPNSNIQLFTQIIIRKLNVEIYIFSFYKKNELLSSCFVDWKMNLMSTGKKQRDNA